MNNLILHKVQGFLDRVSKEGADLDPKLVEEFKEACATSVVRQFANKDSKWRPRMSSLGRPLCQQKMERDGAEKNFEYNSLVRFMFGDLVEAIAILVMKSAGINIESEQEAVKLELGNHSVSGTLDVEIDGKVWDIKSASPASFSNKFGEYGGFERIKEQDTFGYVDQGFMYASGDKSKFGGWIAVNKVTGEFAVCEVPESQEEEISSSQKRIKDKINKLNKNVKFKKGFEDTKEVY